jgi:PleD family two-component response regulator
VGVGVACESGRSARDDHLLVCAAQLPSRLGCVLILYRTIQPELTQSNVDLLAVQEVLQELVDRDPLTGLSNRRALPEVLRNVFETGATILFFDLDDFKGINDSYGHQMGDECLKRFARVLQASFRPDDRVIRYADSLAECIHSLPECDFRNPRV